MTRETRPAPVRRDGHQLRYVLVTPARNEEAYIGRTLESSGVAALTTTTLHGTSVMRLCTINPRTTTDDIDAVLEAIVLHYRG